MDNTTKSDYVPATSIQDLKQKKKETREKITTDEKLIKKPVDQTEVDNQRIIKDKKKVKTEETELPDEDNMKEDSESSDYNETVVSNKTVNKPAKGANATVHPKGKKYMKVIKTQIKVNKFGLCSGEGKLIYSSLFNKTYRNYRVNNNVGWRSKSNDTKQWVGLEFMELFNVSQVQIATADDGSYPTEFYVEYSEDANEFKRIPKKITLKKAPTKPITLEFTSVRAMAIRIAITKYIKWPAARFDFLYTDESCSSDEDTAEDVDQNDQYDYESSVVLNKKRTDNKNYVRSLNIVQVDKNRKEIPNDFINFISLYNSSKRVKTEGYLYGSEIGVLSYSSILSEDNLDYGIDGYGWEAETNTTGEFFGLMFPYAVTVQKIEIRPTDSGAIPTSLRIQYSEDLVDYKFLEKSFKITNFSKNGIATLEIPAVYCMQMNIFVDEWNGWPAARFELLYVDERYRHFLEAAKKMKEKMAAKKKDSKTVKTTKGIDNTVMLTPRIAVDPPAPVPVPTPTPVLIMPGTIQSELPVETKQLISPLPQPAVMPIVMDAPQPPQYVMAPAPVSSGIAMEASSSGASA